MRKQFIALLFLGSFFAAGVCAQQDSIPVIPPVKLNGPRVGLTWITPGILADRLQQETGAKPFLTQFGWQFETRYFTLENGTSGLVELVLLAGGLEQGLFLPSGSLLVGVRNKKGLELGFGPNVSFAGVGFVFAAGFTMKSEYIYFPVNVAVVPSKDGFRVSLLTGFNARRR